MGAPYGDYTLSGYSVDCQKNELMLEARRTSPGEPLHTQLVFSGVLSFHLVGDCFGCILTRVTELPLAQLVAGQERFLREVARESGPMRCWKGSVAGSVRFLQESQLKAYELGSAIGMQGWVIARTFDTAALP